MKTFKESIEDDITNIFFDLELFGTFHDIDGESVNIIIDNEELKRRNDRQSVHTDGLYQGCVLFFAKKKDFAQVPEAESIMRFDGDIFRISDVKEYDGVLEIVLGANLS